jgi:CII-binding regulator of phage lambda lysogenization HflD
MGFFDFGKKDRVVDWSEKYNQNIKERNEDLISVSNKEPEESSDKKQKLIKRLVEIETKLENMSNQIYHIQQRIELLEKKTGIRQEE